MLDFLSDFGQNILLSIPLIGAYVIFALGIVVIFQASRVLNLAHGGMAMAPAYVYFELSTRMNVPVPIALVAAIASGACLGYVVERFFVRPLAPVSPTAQTVGTVAAFGLILAVVAKIFGTLAFQPKGIFPDSAVHVGTASLRWGAIGLFAVGLLVAWGLHALLHSTNVGLGMRAVADSSRAAALMGVNPQRMTSIAWILGGGTAALAGILLAATTNLQPYTLSLQALPAFVSVLIGGLGSLPGAVVGGAVVGTLIGVVPVLPGLGRTAGAPQLMLMLIAFVVMALRGQRFVASDGRGETIGDTAAAAPAAPVPRRTRLWRADAKVMMAALVLAFPALPGVGTTLLGDAGQALIYALVGMSLVLLTGFVGQISLAHASFVGIAAFVTGRVITHVPFPANLPIAAGAAGLLAVALGVVALRIRGLYLAVATLIFAWMSDAYLFQQRWLVGVGGSTSFEVPTLGPERGFPSFDFTSRRTFYYVALATVTAVAASISMLRRSKTGRAFFAIRGSEVAAASLGIDVTRYKLLAFALSGAIAGVAGNLFAANSGVVVSSVFTFTVSLFFLSIAVVGGLTSVGGAIAAGVVFAGLNEIFFRVQALSGYLDIVSSGLLIVVLLAYPAGLAGVPAKIREAFGRLADRIERRGLRAAGRPVRVRSGPFRALLGLGHGNGDSADAARAPDAAPEPSDGGGRLAGLLASLGGDTTREAATSRRQGDPVLAVARVSMRFGGLLAVDDVSLEVRAGEITGLIGPNGAGKTTLFNCVSGLLVPTTGRVELFGTDVRDVPVHRRTAMGLGRTFQVIQLFPQLTVFENLLVATHLHDRTDVVSHAVMTRAALAAERESRRSVAEILRAFDLEDVQDRRASGVPFGVLRMVELARAVLTGARVIMLDEPASGLDDKETERFARLLLSLRSRLDLTFFLIEHDVRLVTSVTDYIYVLDQGRLLAEGLPREIQRDPAVIAAYLGEPAAERVLA